MAREELGRAHLLWKKALKLGTAGSVEGDPLSKELRDHVAKLDAGQSITSFPLPPERLAAYKSALEKGDRIALVAFEKEHKKIVAKVRKRDPGVLHLRRLKAQYVDLNPDGSWSKPSDTNENEAQTLIRTVACEVLNTLLRAGEDPGVAATCKRVKLRLPTYAEFGTRVMALILAGSRPHQV